MKNLYGYKVLRAASELSLKVAAISTERITRSSVKDIFWLWFFWCEIVVLRERKSEYSRDLLRIKWMKTLSLTVSSFALTFLSYCFALLSAFLYSKPFRNN